MLKKAKVKKEVKVKAKTKVRVKAKDKIQNTRTIQKQNFIIHKVSFNVEGLKCGADLYIPSGIKKPPVVIMASGFGEEMCFGIPVYAEKFANNGFAVLTFDYRYFGESEGEPRHSISTKAELKDWASSVEFVRGLKEVDGDKICVWGYSFSGGHVLVTAALNRNIIAFISHMPFLDSIEFMKLNGFVKVMNVNIAAARDIYNSVTGRAPHCIPIVGRPDEFAILNTPECYEGYMSMVPENSRWKNEFPARSAPKFSWYRPVKYIPEIKCRGLVVYAEHDSLLNAASVEKAFKEISGTSLLKLQCGHFGIYQGEHFNKAAAEEVLFLKSVFN